MIVMGGILAALSLALVVTAMYCAARAMDAAYADRMRSLGWCPDCRARWGSCSHSR